MTKFIGVLTVLLLAIPGRAGTFLEEEVRIDGIVGAPAQVQTKRSWIEGDRIKTLAVEQGVVSVLDFKQQKITVMQPVQKVYFELPLDDGKFLGQLPLAQDPEAQKAVKQIEFKKTGRTKKINTWNAYEVVLTGPFPNEAKIALWYSTDLGIEQGDILKQLKLAFASLPAMSDDFLVKLAKLKGFPVQSTTSFDLQGQRVVVTQQVKSAKKQKIAASEFAIPKGYRKIDNPLAGQGPAPAPAPAAPQGTSR